MNTYDNEKILLSLGVDVSKKSLNLAYLYYDNTVDYENIQNTKSDISKLKQKLKTIKKDKDFVCIAESTGDYHFMFAVMLSGLYSVKIINPILSKQMSMYTTRGAKTDKQDSKMLAGLRVLNPEALKYVDFKADLADIRLRKYINALAKIEKIIQEYKMHSVSYVNSLSLFFDREDIKEDTKAKEVVLSLLKKEKRRLERKINALAQDEAREISNKIKGVGMTSIAVVFSFLKHKEFKNRDALVAYFGLDVRAKRSGQFKGKEKISKRGNAFARSCLYRIAWGLVMHNDEYKEYYQKLRQRGLHYNSCLIAVARKFLRFLYAYYYKRTIRLS